MKAARIIIGLAVSALFAWATVSRVDLSEVAQAVSRAALPWLSLAFLFAWLEIGIRAWRWRYLLAPVGRVGYGHALAYLCIGYFANTLLPMRLGDVARAYLAATALRLPRIATLGSIATERLVDGFVTLAVAVALGLAVAGVPSAVSVMIWAMLVLVTLAAAATLAYLSRHPLAVGSLVPSRLRDPLGRLILGAQAIRTVRGACVSIAATLLAYCCAVGAMMALSTSVGLSISWPQAAFVMAWIALSTAIPAAPGSIGAYEFVGVTVLTMLGQDPAASLAVVVLLHVIGTMPVALAGLAATWALHIRLWRLADPRTDPAKSAEPAVRAA